MPLITVRAPAPAIDPGTYPATLIGVAPKRMVTQFSKNGEEQDFLEWTWDVDGAEITSICTLDTGEKATMTKILGRAAGPRQGHRRDRVR